MRFVAVALKSLFLLVLLLLLTLSVGLQFLSTEAGRSLVARELGQAISGSIDGRVDVALHGLTARGLEASASLYDRRGRRLARVEHLSVRLDTRGLVLSWYHGKASFALHDVRAQKLELWFDGDWGSLPKKKGTKAKASSRPEVVAEHVSIERLELAPARILPLRGRLHGSLELKERLRTSADFEGHVAELPLKLAASLDGGKLQGKATLAGYGASARLDVDGELSGRRKLGFQAAIDVPDCRKVPLKRGLKSGTARAKTNGHLDLRTSALNGQLEVDAAELGFGDVTVDQASARGRWRGSLKALPTGRVQVALAGVHAGPWQGASALVASGDVQLDRDAIRVEALASDRSGILLSARATSKLSRRAPLTATVSLPERLLNTLPVP
ncbi:MAG TPA: hypothetical protein VM686_31900, partial [Polyangiaceae bacterium]|nr:hypothetical protein [Polyangiaceae bacterium]